MWALPNDNGGEGYQPGPLHNLQMMETWLSNSCHAVIASQLTAHGESL